MKVELLSENWETKVSPIFSNATTLESLDHIWRDFQTARFDIATSFCIVMPGMQIMELGMRRLSSLATATGPSEVGILPSPDTTEDHGDGMAMLEVAAELSDETAFAQAASEIDWSQRSADDFARAVRLALAAGAHLVARHLAAQGARLYPDHPELQKMAHTLAPPRVVKADLPPVPSVRANQDWLRSHAGEYKGQWVALQNGVLLVAAATASELKTHLENKDHILVTKVL
jgi:hypothetical protein